ncbi:hypothetical protein GCM10027436_56170 [Actinophytocola sediminis]
MASTTRRSPSSAESSDISVQPVSDVTNTSASTVVRNMFVLSPCAGMTRIRFDGRGLRALLSARRYTGLPW